MEPTEPLCAEEEEVRCEIPELDRCSPGQERALHRMMEHYMRRQVCLCRLAVIVGCFLLGCVAFLFVSFGRHNCALEQSPATEEGNVPKQQKQVGPNGPNPFAHLTLFNCSKQDEGYLQWKPNHGKANFTRLRYNASSRALVAPQDGIYHVYLQVTYRSYSNFDCSKVGSIFSQEVLLFSGSLQWLKQSLLLASDSVSCGQSSWQSTIYTAGTFHLNKGDCLRAMTSSRDLIACGRRYYSMTFFGAYLVS